MIKQLGVAVCLLTAAWQATAVEATFEPVTGTPFVADYSRGTKQGNYGIIVLEGSRGGQSNHLASKVAGLGYPVLSVAYFRAPGLPPALDRLPLEYFEAPRQWLLQQPETRPDGVIVLVWSKGAELALLLATHHQEYAGVAAIAPSSVVWSAPAQTSQPASVSSWSLAGEALPFVPLSASLAEREGLLAAFVAGLEERDAVEQARIPVERIAGPVLLLSGEDDRIWPAARMGDQICNRMPDDACTHIRYPEAGHLFDPGFKMGGTVKVNTEAERAVRQELARFLHRLNSSNDHEQ